jgi:2-(1,2-epoxy-1,2-dihydrophenyl)acetyl-CoA isomerase
MTSPLLVERNGAVATLTLNRPDALNTLDFALMDALVAAAADVAADDALRVVVVRGAGRHFMAGGDLRTFAAELAKPPDQRNADFRRMIGRLHSAIESFHRMPHPVVGQVHGAVAGFGLSLMNACDLVIAADDTYFASAYRNIALTPDGGGSWSLPRIVGMRRAMEILLLGERFDAQQALALGLVTRVVPAADLMGEAMALAQRLAAGPTLAYARMKDNFAFGATATFADTLTREAENMVASMRTEDHRGAAAAFVEKREPVFNGR